MRQARRIFLLSVLSAISGKYNIGITALLTGDGQNLQRISVVKKDKGLRIDRRKEYKYQDLASKFMHKRVKVFLVAVDPLKNESEMYTPIMQFLQLMANL